MADRSDDIKQLFSHLGLNPGDYHELRNKSPAGASPAPAAPATKSPATKSPATKAPVTRPAPATAAPGLSTRPVAATPVSAATPVAPAVTRAIPPVPVAAPASVKAAPRVAPSVTVPVPPPPPAPVQAAAPVPRVPEAPTPARTMMPPPMPASSASNPATDNGQRWALLRAVVETPPRVASIEPAPTPSEADENRPTRRLLKELSRRPTESTTQRIVDGARRRWHDPSEMLESAAAAEPPRVVESPKIVEATRAVTPTPVPRATVPMPPEKPVPPARPELVVTPAPVIPRAAPASAPEVALSDAFRRLVAPERTPQQHPSGSSRLRFNYGPDTAPPHMKQPREEKLDDVFGRISAPRRPR